VSVVLENKARRVGVRIFLARLVLQYNRRKTIFQKRNDLSNEPHLVELVFSIHIGTKTVKSGNTTCSD
jgi:hypothetical protein